MIPAGLYKTTVDKPAFGSRPFAQAETMGKSIKHFNLSIRTLCLYPTDPFLHRLIRGDSVACSNTMIGRRLISCHFTS